MAKVKKQYICQSCGSVSIKWLGRCPDCGDWNTFEEQIQQKETSATKVVMKHKHQKKEVVTVTEDKLVDSGIRLMSGLSEIDNLLGGGLMKGSVNLIGGEPGIGKSTILLQLSKQYADTNLNVLYITGEESESQVIQRAKRLKTTSPNIDLYTETCFEEIVEVISAKKYDVVIVDSIQTLYSLDIDSIPGTVSQMRDVTYKLFNLAKHNNISVFLVGHVTKNGNIGGPKVVEHIVDGVFYFEGDKHFNLRIIRANKNRFGSTEEVALFEMKESGLVAYDNSKSLFLSEGEKGAASTIGCIKEGSRYMLVEVQALAVDSNYSVAQRISVGIEQKKNSIILAILEKYLTLELGRVDVFFNVSGGLKVQDSFTDLAIASSFMISYLEVSIKEPTLFVGEISLTGNIKLPSDIERRIAEASKLGIKVIVSPSLDEKVMKKYRNDEMIFICVNSVSNLANVVNNL